MKSPYSCFPYMIWPLCSVQYYIHALEAWKLNLIPDTSRSLLARLDTDDFSKRCQFYNPWSYRGACFISCVVRVQQQNCSTFWTCTLKKERIYHGSGTPARGQFHCNIAYRVHKDLFTFTLFPANTLTRNAISWWCFVPTLIVDPKS